MRILHQCHVMISTKGLGLFFIICTILYSLIVMLDQKSGIHLIYLTSSSQNGSQAFLKNQGPQQPPPFKRYSTFVTPDSDKNNNKSTIVKKKNIEVFFSELIKGTSERELTKSDKTHVKQILLWNTENSFGSAQFLRYLENHTCPVTSACEFTYNRSSLDDAGAVLFNMDYLLGSERMPLYHPKGQYWVFFKRDRYAFINVDLNHFENMFNLTMTYRMASDIPIPYGRVDPVSYSNQNQILSSKFPDNNVTPMFKEQKRKLVAWLVSHCMTTGGREKYVKQLQKFIPVDIYGKCGIHQCPGKKKRNTVCYRMLEKKYKFYLAFENSFCTDYVTEKPFNILDYHMVPIVLGGANYSRILPEHSFIDASRFASAKELAKHLKMLDRDGNAYEEYFAWKPFFRVVHFPTIVAEGYCRLCEILHRSDLVLRIYRNISAWHYNHCKEDTQRIQQLLI